MTKGVEPEGKRRKGLVAIISGPSGSGKSSICQKLIERLPYRLSVSATTRPPRDSERDGEQYYFMSRQEFLKELRKEGFLEHSEHFGNLYGTPRAAVEEAFHNGEVIVLEIDVNGARQLMDRMSEVFCIFVMPPSLQELERRLRGRGTDHEVSIRSRLDRAKMEIEQCARYDQQVVNDDLERSTELVRQLIEAEVARRQ